MTRLMDRTYLTLDEEDDPEGKFAEKVEEALEELDLDTYTRLYVIRVTVDVVDDVVEDDKEKLMEVDGEEE